VTRSSAGTANGMGVFYTAKAANYFSNARADFVDRLPRDRSARILEIGCGNGATGALALSEGRAGQYTGVELFEPVAAQAREVLSEVVTGDIETLELNWQPATFDVLILSEVLEHLVEPRQVVKKLARYIRPGGMVLASSPNISHWRVIRELVLGHFQLTDKGVFDRTHLRWFTPESFAAMFDDAGFKVDEIGPVTPFSSRTEMISKLTGGRFDHLFMTQIALAGTRK
jgi:2-polyprenyl-3-methyl-5-hydroxy-6-metoxy-1,4-benzoquinol methylase